MLISWATVTHLPFEADPFDAFEHLRKMLLASRGSLTDAEVEQLVASLADE